MPDPWVADASPLILLAKVEQIGLLGPSILVPRAVLDEVLAGPPEDPARALALAGAFDSCPSVSVPDPIREWGLGAGESEVLALALQRATTAVLDDAQGRRCARALGVPAIGTLGLVVRAARAGQVPRAAPVLRDLRAAGLWLDDGLVTDVLRRALGEDWTPG